MTIPVPDNLDRVSGGMNAFEEWDDLIWHMYCCITSYGEEIDIFDRLGYTDFEAFVRRHTTRRPDEPISDLSRS